MKSIALITLVCAGLAPAQAADSKLTELTPVAAEYGMVKDPMGLSHVEGPGQQDLGSFGAHFAFFWSDNRKIVKAIPTGFQFKEGESYSSKLENVFAVAGDFVTGVGLWVRCRNMYHRIEYEVPAGATRFTGTLLASDDARGYVFHSNPMNQEFSFRVAADEKEVFALDKQRLQVNAGGGEKLAELDFAIPAGTKRLRFQLTASAWGDGNNNIELVVHDGRFVTAP